MGTQHDPCGGLRDNVFQRCESRPRMLPRHGCRLLAKTQVRWIARRARKRRRTALPGVRTRQSCPGAIAFRLWTTTLYPVEITGGQNLGDRHYGLGSEEAAVEPAEFIVLNLDGCRPVLLARSAPRSLAPLTFP
jgi:hypothetical protein